MDLTDIPGIGPAYSQRLHDAGVPDVESLARAEDLPDLAARTSIPVSRLAAFQADAQQRLDVSGIPIFDPILDNAQQLVRSMDHLAHEVEQTALEFRNEVETKGLKGIAAEMAGQVTLAAQNAVSYFRQLLDGRQTRGGAA